MRKLLNTAMFITFAAASTAVVSENRTVTLAVSGMT